MKIPSRLICCQLSSITLLASVMVTGAFAFSPTGKLRPVKPASAIQADEQTSKHSQSPDRLEQAPSEMVEVGIDEKLGQQIPLALTFTDSTGKSVTLRDYFDKVRQPVILNLGYYRCPMLCDLVINGLAQSVNQLDWTAGEDFQIITVSFDPDETQYMAMEKKRMAAGTLTKHGAESGWHFLTGDSEAIHALTGSVGFRYKWIEDQNIYSHTAAIFILTPNGKVSRCLYGITYPSISLKLALLEASEGKIGSTIDQILMYCFHYNPEEGQYSIAAQRLMSFGGGITVLIVAGAIGGLLVREFIKRKTPATGTE